MHLIYHMLKFLTVALLASSCATTLKPGKPALLADMSEDTLAELTDIVSKALNGAAVTLAPDVLSAKNTLFIEKARSRTLANNPAMGRRMDMPDHFTLSKSGTSCLLTHAESGTTYKLKSANCQVIET